MRTLGIDYGDKRLGFALGDPTGTIASALIVYKRRSGAEDVGYIKKLITDKGVDTVIFGLPLNMDGTEGGRAQICREFGEMIQAAVPHISLVFFDERLSTVTAEEILIEAGVRRDERRNLVDKVAAQVILQSYLDESKIKKGNTEMANQKKLNSTRETHVEFFDQNEENIITLEGDDGKEAKFYEVACVDMDGELYILLQPVETLPEIGTDEVAIFHVQEDDESDADLLLPLEDEALMHKVFDAYVKAAADECECGCDCSCGGDDDCGCN